MLIKGSFKQNDICDPNVTTQNHIQQKLAEIQGTWT